jgi:hypothetical protein
MKLHLSTETPECIVPSGEYFVVGDNLSNAVSRLADLLAERRFIDSPGRICQVRGSSKE